MATHSGSHQQHRSRSGPGGSPAGSSAAAEETYYQLLDVPFTATKAEITAAYRRAMRSAHPDRVPPHRREAAESLSKALNAAYATLSNPAKRRAYDETIRPQVVQEQIMKRYVGGFAGPAAGGGDPFAQGLKRNLTGAEKRDRRRSERSAIISVLSVFLVVSIGAIGLLILFALVSLVMTRVF
ncbi:MAG: J domain-containing protein [Thermomicrobiales bacterium]